FQAADRAAVFAAGLFQSFNGKCKCHVTFFLSGFWLICMHEPGCVPGRTDTGIIPDGRRPGMKALRVHQV
ncbi:MAG: hypothetical protein KBG60_09405, partial [Anaerolineaceae bacterium]|nr:hypothetical protein [Anaerolineaceae bacterium]